jgi:predicted dehydrogenase
VRVLLIGAGVIARTHASAAALLGEPVEVLAADPSPQARAGFAEAHPEARLFDGAEQMLAEPAADDVVIVATPPRHHVGPALAALATGRHVLVEKPFALDVAGAERVAAAAEAAGRLLGTCSTRFRGLPHTEAVKAAMRDDLIGEPYALRFQTVWARSRAGIEYQPQSRWFLDSAQAGGGVLMDWGPYDVSTLLDLLRPRAVEVRDAWIGSPRTPQDPQGIPHDVESHAGASMRFHLTSGAMLPVVLERANHTAGEPLASAELLGARGALQWVPFDSAQPVRHRAGDDTVTELPRPATLPWTPFDRPLVYFHRALRGRPSFAALGTAAVDELRLIRAIYDIAAGAPPRTVAMSAPIATAASVEELL